MEFLAPRLESIPRVDLETLNVIQDIDEAMECLMRDEQKSLVEAQCKGRCEQDVQHHLHEAFRSKMAKIRGAPAEGAKKAKGEKIELPESMELMPQHVVKRFFPASECLVWKSRSPPCWHVQVKGWPGEHSRSVAKWVETQALKLLITEAWYDYAILQGKALSDMPVVGLLPLDSVFADRS